MYIIRYDEGKPYSGADLPDEIAEKFAALKEKEKTGQPGCKIIDLGLDSGEFG